MDVEKDKIKCISCARWASPTILRFDGDHVRGWQCACGEQILNSEDAEWLLLRNKTKKTPYLASVSKVGNSYSVRLPKELVDLLKLKDQKLRIHVGIHEILLSPV